MSSLTQGRETTLEEMLDLREERAARQRQMLACLLYTSPSPRDA